MATSYVKDTMAECLSGGLDDELREMAAKDAEMFGHFGVSNERERNLVLYLDFFLNDLVAEMGRPLPAERGLVIQAAFEQLRGKDDVDLTDIRRAVFSALDFKPKQAYHNTMGVMDSNLRPQRDLSKWIRALGAVFTAQRAGETRSRAVDTVTKDWDPVEALDFRHWVRYYEKGDHEKYGLQTTAAQEEQMAPAEFMRAQTEKIEAPAQQPAKRRRGRPPRTVPKTLDDRKNFIVGRLDAVRRELRNFVSAWPSHVWHQLYQTLADLEQQIVSLKTESSMRDCIIRTAGIWEKQGITGGARALRKIAQPPGGNEDVVSQIEKALTGREYEIGNSETAPAGGAELPPPPMPEDLGAAPPPPAPESPAGEEPMGSPPPAAMEELPEAPPPPPPKEEKKKKPSKDENPYSGSTVRDVLNVLEPLARTFKERETVRQMSKADMMMDALGIVSYFPELGEAVARIIETDSYVSTRLEKIMNKLRGSMGGGEEEEEEEKGEEPPIVEMQPPATEEAAAEVIEAPPAAAEETAAEAVETPAPPAAEETAAEAVEAPPPGA